MFKQSSLSAVEVFYIPYGVRSLCTRSPYNFLLTERYVYLENLWKFHSVGHRIWRFQKVHHLLVFMYVCRIRTEIKTTFLYSIPAQMLNSQRLIRSSLEQICTIWHPDARSSILEGHWNMIQSGSTVSIHKIYRIANYFLFPLTGITRRQTFSL